MYATIGSVVINIILNPLFIFGFGWGIRGSAIATVIAQVVMMCWQFHIFSDKSNFLHFQKGIYRLKKHIVLTSMSIGLSPFLMNVASCFLVVLINQGLKHYGGDMAIGAFSNVNRIMFIFGMIVMGFNQAMQPIAGYNFGAQLYTRVTQVLKITIVCATAVMVLGFFIGEFMPRQVALIFTNDEELIRQTVLGLRLCFISAPVVGFQMVTSNFFQSIGMAKKSIFLSLTRQLIFLLPAILILPPIYGLNGVWLSMPISDLVATFTSAAMLAYQFRKFHRGDKIKTV
jgi:Na+-driven multidrug efflux pump